MSEDHKCFTVSVTNCPVPSPKDRYAIHFQKPPKKTAIGHSVGLRFPLLMCTAYLADADKTLALVAEILNENAHRFVSDTEANHDEGATT